MIYPGLANESLLSIGQFFDDDCIAIFTKANIYIIKNNDIVVHGYRNKIDGLWDVSLPTPSTTITASAPPPKAKINYIIKKNKAKTELAQYFHASLFSPPLSTLSQAINRGNIVTWPGIDNINFKSILGTTAPLEKGHLDQERKHLQPTNKSSPPITNDNFPAKEESKTYNIFVTISHTSEDNFFPKEKSYSDQTGKFPYISSRGNQYIFTMHDYDSNVILLHPLKTKQGKEIVTAFENAIIN